MGLPVEAILSLLEAHPYLWLFPLVLVEGPIATVSAGSLVATGFMSWPVAYAVAVAADLAGDTLYYLLGRSARRPRPGRLLVRLGLTWEKLAAVEASFGRNDAKAIVGAKIADFAAIPVFVAAGMTKMGYGRFLGLTLAATVPKAAILMALGYFAGGQVLHLAGRLDPPAAALLVLLAPITCWLVAKKVMSRIRKHRIRTSSKEENR